MLHSVAATVMGFCFALGVVVRVLHRHHAGSRVRVLDIVALLAATVDPVLMTSLPAVEGVLQRLIFLAAYLWFGGEARMLYGLAAPTPPSATGGQ